MSRSVKKGPFVDAKLMKRVIAMNSGGRREVLRTWSVTSWASSLSPGCSAATPRAARKRREPADGRGRGARRPAPHPHVAAEGPPGPRRGPRQERQRGAGHPEVPAAARRPAGGGGGPVGRGQRRKQLQ